MEKINSFNDLYEYIYNLEQENECLRIRLGQERKSIDYNFETFDDVYKYVAMLEEENEILKIQIDIKFEEIGE